MKHVAYYRVSTVRQGRSGLGLDAQKKVVRDMVGEPIAEFVETESGKRSSRPELKKAIERAKKEKAVLVVAKLDRLARSTHFLLGLVESGVDVMFCDLPQLPPGHMGKFFLTMMAAVAELEAGMISDRTKSALAQAKANGTELGKTGKIRAAENRERAVEAAKRVAGEIRQAREGRTLAETARVLNDNGTPSPGGGKWYPETVRRAEARI